MQLKHAGRLVFGFVASVSACNRPERMPQREVVLPEWHLRLGRPVLTIGAQNDTVLVGPTASATRLPDGRLLLLNSDPTWLVRVFSPHGQLLTQLRNGRGPTELLAGVAWIADHTDSLIFSQGQGVRYTVFDHTLRRSRVGSVNMNTLSRNLGSVVDWDVDPKERTATGQWLCVAYHHPREPEELTSKNVLQMEEQWIVAGPHFDNSRILAHFTGPELWIGPSAGGVGISAVVFSAIPFLVVHHGVLYSTTNQAPEFELRDTSGRPLQRIRLPLPHELVTANDRRHYYEDIADARARADARRAAAQLPAQQRNLPRVHFATEHRFFDDMLVTAEGEIWAALAYHGFNGPTVPHRYVVVSPAQGKMVAAVTVPPGVSIYSVWSDTALVKVTDADGGETLQVVSIEKPSPSAPSPTAHGTH